MKLGVIGLGRIGKIHVEMLKTIPLVSTIAVYDPNPVEREIYVTDSLVDVYDELNRFWEACNVVSICTPTYLHEEYVLEAAKLGKAIICEKPIAKSIEEAMHMLEACQDNNVPLFVGQVLRFYPEFQIIRRYIQENKLGKVKVITANRYSGATGTSWNQWIKDDNLGGIIELFIHDLDFILWSLGKPTQLSAQAIKDQQGNFTHLQTHLNYGEDQIASINASFLVPPSHPFTSTVMIHGEKATLSYVFQGGTSVFQEGGGTRQLLLYHEDEQSPVALELPTGEYGLLETAIKNELEHFLNCIQVGQNSPIVTAEEATFTLDVGLKLMREVATKEKK